MHWHPWEYSQQIYSSSWFPFVPLSASLAGGNTSSGSAGNPLTLVNVTCNKLWLVNRKRASSVPYTSYCITSCPTGPLPWEDSQSYLCASSMNVKSKCTWGCTGVSRRSQIQQMGKITILMHTTYQFCYWKHRIEQDRTAKDRIGYCSSSISSSIQYTTTQWE